MTFTLEESDPCFGFPLGTFGREANTVEAEHNGSGGNIGFPQFSMRNGSRKDKIQRDCKGPKSSMENEQLPMTCQTIVQG